MSGDASPARRRQRQGRGATAPPRVALALLTCLLAAASVRAEEAPEPEAWRAQVLAAAERGDAVAVRTLADGPPQDAARAVAILAEAGEAAAALGHLDAAAAAQAARFVLAAELPDGGAGAWAALRALEEVATRTEDAHDDAVAHLFAGGLLARSGRVHEGIAHLEQAVAGLAGAPRDLAQAQATLAQAHVMAGHYGAALHYSEAAEALCRSLGFREGVLYARSGRIATYSELGLDEEAIALGRIQEAEAGDDAPGDRATARMAMAIAEARLGQRKESANHFAQAIEQFAASQDTEQLAIALLNRGRELHGPAAALDDATKDFERAQALDGLDPRLRLYAAISLADVRARQARWAKARAAYAQILAEAETLGDDALSALAHTGLAEAALAAGQAQTAHDHAARATEGLLAEVGTLGHVEGTGLLGVRESQRATRARLEAALALGDPVRLHDAIEASRAVALLANAGGWERLRRVAVPDEVEIARDRAQTALDEARRRREVAREGGAPPVQVRTLLEAALAAEGVYQQAEARVQREVLRLARAARPHPVSLRDLQAWLRPDEAFVHTVLVGQTLHALVVQRTTAVLRRVADLASLHDVLGGVDALRDADEPATLDTDGASQAASALGALLMAPLGLPATTRSLVVAPAPQIANLPWPVLARGRPVTVVPSASLLLAQEHGPLDAKRPRLLVGVSDYRRLAAGGAQRIHAPTGRAIPDLPGAAQEARSLARPGLDVVLAGPDAQEATVSRRLADDGDWSTLHFACHGLLHRRHPALSSLALLPGDGADGFLTVAEVLSLRMQSGLVVLSACDTGTMLDAPGEGYVGLPPAILASGARRVLCNLWPVSDKAGAAFMALFYEELGRTPSPAAALRVAQRRLREVDPRWRHPYYWAGWVLWGSPR